MPCARQTSMSSVPAGAVSFLPSTVKVTSAMNSLGRYKLRHDERSRSTISSGRDRNINHFGGRGRFWHRVAILTHDLNVGFDAFADQLLCFVERSGNDS